MAHGAGPLWAGQWQSPGRQCWGGGLGQCCPLPSLVATGPWGQQVTKKQLLLHIAGAGDRLAPEPVAAGVSRWDG